MADNEPAETPAPPVVKFVLTAPGPWSVTLEAPGDMEEVTALAVKRLAEAAKVVNGHPERTGQLM